MQIINKLINNSENDRVIMNGSIIYGPLSSKSEPPRSLEIVREREGDRKRFRVDGEEV